MLNENISTVPEQALDHFKFIFYCKKKWINDKINISQTLSIFIDKCRLVKSVRWCLNFSFHYDLLIDFNGMSTNLGLFFAKS